MSDIKQRIKEVSREFEKIEESLDLPEKQKRMKILESESAASDFWDDQEKATIKMQELGDLKKEVEQIEKLSERIKDLEELSKDPDLSKELEKEVKGLEKEMEKFRLQTFLSDQKPFIHQSRT